MALASCSKCFKYAVFVFNFVLWLVGCSLLAVGGWLLAEEDAGQYVEEVTSTSTDHHSPLVISYSQATDSDVTRPLAFLFLVFGAVMVLTAFVGCCGAVRDNTCLLTTYLVMLVLIFAVLLGIGAWSFASSKKVNFRTHRVNQLTSGALREAVHTYYTEPESRRFMDTVQSKFSCCGADNATDDYIHTGPVDDSPCDPAYLHTSCIPVYFSYVAQHFEAFVESRLLLVAHLSVAFALCLVVVMVFVVLLCCAEREKRGGVNV